MVACRKWILPFLLLVFQLLHHSTLITASHFRGGIVQWRPLNAQNFDGRIEITHRMAWRRSWSGNGCTSSDIGTTQLFGLGALSCQIGCSGQVGSLQFYCTNFDAVEDWVSGDRTYTYNIGTVPNFEASFTGGCWISLGAGGCGWEIRVKGNLIPRSDNGLINSSPVTTTTPIVRLQSGCTHNYRIPVQDADQDTVRCRWATGNECADVCQAVPGATLDSATCVLTWTASHGTNSYAVAIQVEDFLTSSSTTPMSSVPLQFLIFVFTNSQPCTGGIRPSLIAGETPPDNSCIPVPFGTTYTAGLVAASGGSAVSILRFTTVSPFGLRTSGVVQSQYNSQLYYANVTWMPIASQFGLQQFCFRALSSNGLETSQSCITLLGGVTGPAAQANSVSPRGRFSPTASTLWSITFDQSISRPGSSRYIRFYDSSTNQNVHSFDVTSSTATFPATGSMGRTMTFRFNFNFVAGASYYVLIDSGAAVGTEFCNQESLSVTSNTFWSFSTGCPTGYRDNGGVCVDCNECANECTTATCPANSRCVNTVGSYTCPCSAGFELSSGSCRDIDECARGTHRCHAAATCTNTVGSYQCTCPPGSAGDGMTCTDLCDECRNVPAGCGTNNCNATTADCTNTIGSFQCSCRFGQATDGVSCAPPPRPDPPRSVSISSIGTSSITVTWLSPIASIGNRISSYNLVLTETGRASITVSTSGTAYTFTGLQEYRVYSCVITAVSIYGPVSVATASVIATTLEAVPSAPPTGFVATPSTSRSATINWSPPPPDEINGIITQYIINVTVVGTGNTFQLTSSTNSLTVSTLSPYTTYICIIAAVTSIGIGPFSAQFTLITPQDAPSRPPQNIVLSPVSSTSISLSWSPPPSSDINGVVTEYRITITEVITGRISNLVSTTASITATGLHPYYAYQCIVSAFTVGIGPYSQVFSITTPEDVPSGSPLNFGGSATSSRSATISWNPPQADLQNGVIIRYIINVTVVETGQFFQLTSTTTSSLTVTTLLPFRNYICIIAAVTSVGIGPFSVRFTLTTPQDVPTRSPQTPTVVTRDSETIFCSWTPPPLNHHNGIIVQYRINLTEVITGRVSVHVSTTTSLEITSLHPDYVYQWVVTAVTTGIGPYTSVSSTRTPEDVPSGPPQSPSVSVLSSQSFEINWLPPLLPDQNGVITGYIVVVTPLTTGISQQLITSVTNTITVPNLAPFTNYVCTMAAINAEGRGPFSIVITAQTLEAAPGAHPSNFTGSALNSTHIYLSWDPPPPIQVNGIIREYRLNVTENATGNVLQYTTTPTNRQITIGSLHPYYIYHCAVTAITVQQGPYTAVYILQTAEDVPSGPPTNFATSTSGTRGISLSWSPPQLDQQNGILRYYVITLTSALPTVVRNVSASLLNVTIGGLRPYTPYFCTVRVATIGLGPVTAVQRILTPEDVPSGPPLNLRLLANSSRSLVLNWDVPLPQEVNGIVVDYTVNISSSMDTNTLQVGSNITTYTISSLRPYVTYTCIMAAHTSVGRGPFSVSVTITTPEGAPEAPPTSISQRNVMPRSVDLSWIAPRKDLQNGVIRYYVLEVYENNTGNSSTYQTLSARTSYTISNLHPYYTYSIRILAVTVGSGPLSISHNVNTMQDVPTAAPMTPSGSPLTSTLINLRWSPIPAEHVNGMLRFYLVDVTEVITNNSWTFHAVQTHINIGPLHPYYTYRCRVTGFTVGLGPYTAFFYVNSGETYPTGAPANLTSPRATTTSLSLSWDPPRFNLQNGIIRYYTVFINDLTNGSSLQLTSNTTRILVENLQPFFTYNCTVAAFTIGLGPVSDPLTIILPQAAPSVAPTNIRGLAINHSSISLDWDTPPALLTNGIVTVYIVNVTERETGYTFERNATSTSIVLNSLHPDYVYECRVAAFTIAAGPFSTIFAVQVLMAAPSGPPDNITAMALSSTSMMISWSPPFQQFRNGPILAYNFTVMESSTGIVVRSSILLNMSATVFSLRPFTTYNFTLSARTSVGYGPSDTISAITLEDTPSGPTNPQAWAVSGDPYSLYFAWMPPSVTNGYILQYSVYCQESQLVFGSGSGMYPLPTAPSLTIFTSSVRGSQLNATVMGLEPFTNYGCYVTANTSIGEGNTSATIFQTTDEFIPVDPPTNLQVSIVNATSVYLSWSLPLIPYGNIVSYTILVEQSLLGGSNITTVIVNASLGTSFTVEELLPYTFYNFSVAASTRIGRGPYDLVTTGTPQASPYGSPRSLMATVSGTTTANISWSMPDPTQLNGIITYYTVVLSDQVFGLPDRIYNTTLTSFNFTGLEEYGRYACQVAAATIGGLGPLGNPVTFTTYEAIPVSPPQNVSGSALSSSLIMLFWSPPPPRDVNGAIRYYTVEAIERHTGRQWTFFAVDADLHIGSLHPYYFYDFNVSATTIGRGPFSATYSILTLPEPPIAAPEQISSVSTTSTSLTISWNPPPFEDTNGPIQYYMVRVTEVDTNTALSPMTTFAILITFTGLHPYYTYQCSVAAYTVGLGPYTSPITIQLNQESPTAPALNLVGSPRSSDSIFLSWDPPLFSERNGVIQNYLVNITEMDTGNTYGHVSLSTNFTLFSLHPFYTYSITVTAVTVAPGPPTSPVVILTNEDIPSGPAQDVNITVISSEEALIMWEALELEDQNGIVTSYSINVTEVRTGQTFQVISTTNAFLLDNLQPFTTYTCRVAAVTSVGVGPYSIATGFMTEEAAPSSPPTNLMASTVSSTSVSLIWLPPNPLATNGIVTQYRINLTETNTGRTQQLISFNTSFVVQMLHPYYTYTFSVSAHTVATGPYSISETLRMPEDIPSGSPQMFMENIQSPNSITFSWIPPRDEDQNGRITAYTINITETGSGVTIQRTVSGSQITVSSLLPFTAYFCSIAASTSVGTGPFSTFLTVNTPEDSPALSPLNPVGSAQDSATILLSWDVPGSPHNGIIREYRLNVTEVETGRVNQEVSATTTLTVSNLHPDYSYDWIVTAFTVGVGPYSVSSRVTTPEDVPSGPPMRVNASALTSTSIYISWSLPIPEDRNGDITGYVINVTNLDSGMIQQFTTAVMSITVPSLRPFTIYVATVSARTAVGMGPFSSVVSVQTIEDAPGSHPLNSSGSALNSTHIFLDWSPPSAADVNGIIREYRINCTEGETNILRQLTTDSSTTDITVGPLHPFYIYHCTILAFTVEGGPNTTIISIRTEEDAPSAPPTTVTARSTSARSVSVGWGPPSRDQQNGILRHYLVTLVSNVGVMMRRNISSTQQLISISGLRPYTQYSCTVQAETIALGPASPVVQVNTPQDLPTGPPQNVLAQIVDATTLSLSWSPPIPERRNGLIQQYIISITELDTGTTSLYNSTQTSIVIGDRHPFYRYSYIIAAETIGLGPYSVASMTHMPEAAPSSPPRNIQISAVSSSGFLISWSVPPAVDHNGNIRSYIINVTEENTGNMFQFTSNTNSLRVESRHPYYNYTCIVSAVTVATGPYSAPTAVTTLENVPTGSPVNFLPVAMSSTSVLLTWDPPPIHEQNGVITGYTIIQVSAGSSSTLTTSRLMLMVLSLRPFTSYTFDISANTGIGSGPFHTAVTVTTPEAAPDGAPDNVMSSNITSTSLTLTWTAPQNTLQNGVIRHYIITVVEVDTGTNFTYQAQSHTTFSVGDLHPYYTYRFNVHAVTIEVGPASLDHTVTALQDIPTAPPMGISEMATDSRTLLISWRPPPVAAQNGIITEYLANISVLETGEQLQRRAADNALSLSIDSLHPDYTYTYLVSAATAIGMGPFSAFRSIRLPEDVPTSAPLNTAGRTINSTAIIFTWDHPPPAGRNGNITGYSLLVTELITNTTTSYRQTGAHIELVIASLHPFYEYECVIAAETRVGRGPYGMPFITRTNTDAPSGLPSNVVAVVVTSRSIRVSWEPPLLDQQNGIIQHYLVMVMVQQTRASLSLNSTFTSLTIPNLHPAYLYTVEVAAVTVSVGPYASAVTITTPDDVPTGAPLRVTAASVSSTSIRISWQAPRLEFQNGDITSYHIIVLELETGATQMFTTVPTDSIYVVNGLHPFYNYNCSVAAYTNGLGPANFYVVRTLSEEPSESPTNVSVIPLNATTVVASWTPPLPEHRNGIIQGYTIRVVGVHTPEDFTVSINSTETMIGNLHPFYSYKLTVATVTISHGPFSNPVTVMIPPFAPSQMVSNVTVSSLSPTSVRLRWLPPNLDEWNGIISRYTIEYALLRQVQGEDDDDDDQNTPPNLRMNYVTYAPLGRQRLLNNPDPRLTVTPLVWEELEIVGLQEYFVYSFMMYYENSAGRSVSSDVVELNIPPAAPTGPPTNVIVSTQSETSFVVQWSPPELLERNGPINGYEVTLIYRNGTRRVYSMLGSTFNFQIEGLPKFSELNITVAARTDEGLGPMSVPTPVDFRVDVPEAPGSLKADVSKTSVTLTWSPPTNPNGRILEYQVNYYGYKEDDITVVGKQTGDISVVQDGPYVVSVPPDETIFQIHNLRLGYTYSFKVRARTAPGYGPNSTDVTIVIADDPTVGELSGGSVGSTGVALIILGIGWLLLVIVIVAVVAAYIWRRKHKHRSLNIFASGAANNKRYRGGEVVGVQNTNFYEVEGQSRSNPAAGLELNDADYTDVLQNEGADIDDKDQVSRSDKASKLAFHEDQPSEDEMARLEEAALAKCRAIEGDEDEEDDADEKTTIDLKDREYEDNEIVYL